MIFLFLFFSFGCSGNGDGENLDYQKALKDDAVQGLSGAIAEDYTQLTIIRGSLYKYSINPSKPQYLGITIGALQAMVFPTEYEYDRLTKLESISPAMKKDIIAQPMLNIVMKKRDVFSHLYSDLLEPLNKQIDEGKPVTPQQIKTLNETVRVLDRMVTEYATLIKPGLDFNGREAEDAFLRLQGYHKELQKIKLPPYNPETP